MTAPLRHAVTVLLVLLMLPWGIAAKAAGASRLQAEGLAAVAAIDAAPAETVQPLSRALSASVATGDGTGDGAGLSTLRARLCPGPALPGSPCFAPALEPSQMPDLSRPDGRARLVLPAAIGLAGLDPSCPERPPRTL